MTGQNEHAEDPGHPGAEQHPGDVKLDGEVEDEDEHEVRVALVMNGGVSLAVWMAGMTHELDLVRRVTTPGSPAPGSYDEPVAQRWRDLLAARDGRPRRRVVIDVVAGTSAGGLNGTMLATAIAHEGTLDPPRTGTESGGADGPWLREEWCRLGALELGKLLPAADSRDGRGAASLLDGDFFLTEATRLLGVLSGGRPATTRHAITLFTTASGLGVQGYEAQDAAGARFEVSDHRFLYRFSTDRPARYQPDALRYSAPPEAGSDFDCVDTLARAARASASFPVAFAPVYEDDLLNQVGPPRERPRQSDTQPSWLMDGGVLDNAPFGPVLEQVARAPVSSHATRYVMYVVPSSGVGRASTAVEAPAGSPDPLDGGPRWTTTLGSAIQFPREVDFRSDVEDLERLRLEADASWSDTQRLFDRASRDPHEQRAVVEAAERLMRSYTRGRGAGGVWEAITVSQAGRATVLDTAAALDEDDVDAIMAARPLWTSTQDAAVEPTFLDGAGASHWPWGLGPAERVARLVQRRLRADLGAVLASDPAPADRVAGLGRALTLTSEVITNILAVRASLTSHVVAAELGPGTDPATATRTLNAIFADHRVTEALGAEIARLAAVCKRDDLVETALAVEVVSRCTSARTPNQRSAPFAFLRLGPDVDLPVVGAGSRTVAAALGDRALYGTQVGHFGAFGAERWRRWDWLLGRLHAVAHLGRLLHEGTHAQATAWIAATQQAVLDAEGCTVDDLERGLADLADFPVGPTAAWGGVTRMVKALNEEATTAAPAAATIGIGDRLVAASRGLGKSPGRWVRALTARDDPGGDPSQAIARWLAEPARDRIWSGLTGGVVASTASRSWVRILLSRVLWLAVGVTGALAFTLAVVIADDAGGWAVLLGALGAVALALAAVMALATRGLIRLRQWLGGLVDRIGAG